MEDQNEGRERGSTAEPGRFLLKKKKKKIPRPGFLCVKIYMGGEAARNFFGRAQSARRGKMPFFWLCKGKSVKNHHF